MLVLTYALVLSLFVLLLLVQPYQIIRPSIWISLSIILQVNGASAFFRYSHGRYFHELWMFSFLSIVFPLGVLAWAVITPDCSKMAKELFRRCNITDSHHWRLSKDELAVLVLIGFFSLIILVIYLYTVPLRSTGLASVLFDPINAALAREESLKFLPAPLRYSYLFHIGIFAPILVAIIVIWQPRSLLKRIFRICFLLLLIISVCLTGARSPAGNLLLVIALTFLLRKGLIQGGIIIALATFFAIFIAICLTIARQGYHIIFSLEEIFSFIRMGILYRVFVTPFETGIWTILYARENRLLGIANIRPLALLFGIDYIDLPNVAGLAFAPNPLESVSANTCFLFDYQASFGLIGGWLISLLLLCSLDYSLLAFHRLKGGLLIAFLACFLLSLRKLYGAAFTTCLFSHGIIQIMVLAMIIGSLQRKSLRAYRYDVRDFN